jgi:hypothetical protein
VGEKTLEHDMGAVACVVSEHIHWDWNFFRRKVQKNCWFGDQKANFLAHNSLLSVKLSSDWIFIWYFTKKNHILRNFSTFYKLAKATMAKSIKKWCKNPLQAKTFPTIPNMKRFGWSYLEFCDHKYRRQTDKCTSLSLNRSKIIKGL